MAPPDEAPRRIRVEVEANRRRLVESEDGDGDRRITVEDSGPKRFELESLDGAAFQVTGTRRLANLLEELSLASEAGEAVAEIDPERLFEDPVSRLSRRIRDELWDNLTRRVDADGLDAVLVDSKAGGAPARLYVPAGDERGWRYFSALAERRGDFEAVRLPPRPTPEQVRRLNRRPGLLALALEEDAEGTLRGVPFVVPGGRFNEMYGWDSYFEALGLIADGRVELARAMVDNFVYQIRFYGRILNANRSYYLTRSQPPFLTAMARAVFDALPTGEASRRWLGNVVRAAIREYRSVWMAPPRLTATGLSRYRAEGIGIPPETEPGHFAAVLAPWARRAGMEPEEYEDALLRGEIDEPGLADYWTHDRSVRESGHDTSYRLEGRAARLLTVDLAALLYRYETDVAELLESGALGSGFRGPDGAEERAEEWRRRAAERRRRVDELLWDEAAGFYFDYDLESDERTGYEAATTFYPLWAGLASPAQAERLVERALPRLEAAGGLLASSAASRGSLGRDRPPRQWDYPNGWAPHQMLSWSGLERYGHAEAARRLASRWLYTIAVNAAQYNGTVPEKFDVVARSHRVFSEYGNVGTDFAYITREGFGWMNASFQVGLGLLTPELRGRLAGLVAPEWLFGAAPAE